MKTALKLAAVLLVAAAAWLIWFGIDLIYGFSQVH